MPPPTIGPVRRDYLAYQGRSIPRIGPAPYPRPVPSIRPAQGNPDWWNQFVEPQLETFQQQPLMRVKGLFDSVLGDPSDPTNMAVGWLAPAARRSNSKVLLEKLAQKMEGSKNNIDALDIQLKIAPNRSQDIANQALEEARRFTLARDTLDTAKKYPHVVGHLNELETPDKIPPSLFDIFGGNPKGDYSAGLTPHSQRIANRNLDPSKAREIAKAKVLENPAYRGLYGKYVDGSYLDSRVQEYLKDYEQAADYNNKFADVIQRHPALKREPRDPEDYFGSSLKHHNSMIKGFNDWVDITSKEFVPKPEGRIRVSKESENVPITTRHELGHAATSIKGEPSAWQYQEDKKRYGYWLTPDEIRARAVADKSKPFTREEHDKIYLPEIFNNKRMEGSYSKNDYYNRIWKSIMKGVEASTPEQINAFWQDVMSGSAHMPTRWVDSPRGGKVSQPFRDWMKEVAPGSYGYINRKYVSGAYK